MSVIEASSVRIQTMADSTLRLTVDIEPRFANDAFSLFGKVGTPLALAALKIDKHAEPAPVIKLEPKAHIGEQCWKAVDLCADKRFWEWVAFATLQVRRPTKEAEAKAYILDVCNIQSRKDLDTDPEAADRFNARLFRPFNLWLDHQRRRGVE